MCRAYLCGLLIVFFSALFMIVPQEALAKSGLAQPARIAVAEGPYFALDKENPPANKGMLNQAVKYAVCDPFSPQWREIESKFIQPALDLIFNGKESIKSVVDRLAPEVNRLLQDKKS